MTTPILPNTFTGAVPEGFTLPWNTTRTMADVWAPQAAEVRSRAGRQSGVARRRLRDEALAATPPPAFAASGKRPFAGYDQSDRWNSK